MTHIRLFFVSHPRCLTSAAIHGRHNIYMLRLVGKMSANSSILYFPFSRIGPGYSIISSCLKGLSSSQNLVIASCQGTTLHTLPAGPQISTAIKPRLPDDFRYLVSAMNWSPTVFLVNWSCFDNDRFPDFLTDLHSMPR